MTLSASSMKKDLLDSAVATATVRENCSRLMSTGNASFSGKTSDKTLLIGAVSLFSSILSAMVHSIAKDSCV